MQGDQEHAGESAIGSPGGGGEFSKVQENQLWSAPGGGGGKLQQDAGHQ